MNLFLLYLHLVLALSLSAAGARRLATAVMMLSRGRARSLLGIALKSGLTPIGDILAKISRAAAEHPVVAQLVQVVVASKEIDKIE